MTYTYLAVKDKYGDGDEALTIVDALGIPQVTTRNQNIIDMVKLISSGDDVQEALENIVTSYDSAATDFKERFLKFNSVDMEDVADVLRSVNTSSAIDAFVSKVDAIEDMFTRENLKKWISTNKSIKVTESGDVIGYKGVRDDFTSVHAGYGIINGTAMRGNHDCTPGNVVEMPREMVNPDTTNPCSFGLHVGNLKYAEGWASRTVRVKFRPEDAVAVAYEKVKLRVCRYEILAEMSSEEIDAVLASGEQLETDLGNEGVDEW